MIKKFNDIRMVKMNNMAHVLNELKKGNYIVFADNVPLKYGVDILTQDILYYDEKNKRIRFMLAKNWALNKLLVYPVRSVMTIEGLNNWKETFSMMGLFFNNYDVVYSAEPKYIHVILDNYKDLKSII